MALDLTPNEIVGYRIKPDWHSINVVIVKRKGPSSKDAGKDYDTPLGYCKSLPFAVSFIVAHAARVQGELNQKEALALTGSVADATVLLRAFEYAEGQALQAVAELQSRIDALGLSRKELVRSLGTVVEDEEESVPA